MSNDVCSEDILFHFRCEQLNHQNYVSNAYGIWLEFGWILGSVDGNWRAKILFAEDSYVELLGCNVLPLLLFAGMIEIKDQSFLDGNP